MNTSTTTIQAGNATWQGRRQQQQDAFGFSDFNNADFRRHAGVLMALADGMGGMQGGREAAQLAIKHLLLTWATKRPDEPIPAALERALAAANRAVYDWAQAQRFDEGEVGTTLVAAAVHQEAVYWISAGDSRLYLYQASNQSLTQCTDDHSRANRLRAAVLRGEASASALEDPDAEALYSFLGLREIPAIDHSLRPRPLAPGDRLLLCSDGVYNNLSTEQIIQCLRPDAPAAADALIALVQKQAGPHQDNATVTVMALELTDTTIIPTRSPPTATRRIRPEPRTQRVTPKLSGLQRWLIPLLAGLALIAIGVGIGGLLFTPTPTPTPTLPTTERTSSLQGTPSDDALARHRVPSGNSEPQEAQQIRPTPDEDAPPAEITPVDATTLGDEESAAEPSSGEQESSNGDSSGETSTAAETAVPETP